jgi:hypothetical protein
MSSPQHAAFAALARKAWLPTALVALCSLTALAQTIPNPSFELDTFTGWPGYISGNAPITDWTGTPETRVGLNPASGSPFADNGAIPDGNNVALIQANVDDPATPSTLSTTISGLTVGTTYKVTFRANARGGNTPNVKVYLDGWPVLLPGGPDGFSTAPVTGANPYWTVALEFQATATSQTLAVVNDASGDQTLLVDDFKIAPTSGKWSVAPWTGDADSGVDAQFFYTHAYNFGSYASTVINGITFIGVGGGSPAVAGRFSTAFLASLYTGDANNLTGAGDGSSVMATDFVYGGNVPGGQFQSITLLGLTPGMEYVVTVYSMAWDDPAEGTRWATFSMEDDCLTVNQDAYYNDNGILMSYGYTADASGTATVKIRPLIPTTTIHVYGFSNREAISRDVAPVIIVQPQSAIVSPDISLTLSTVANAVPSPTFQWRFNGQNIAGATADSYTIDATSAATAGAYDVVVANRAGSVTSVVAQVTVGLPMLNPSFEADVFTVWPGYVSGNFPITGWNALGGHGINPANGSPFADNGAIPNGSQVAFMQADGAMSQTLTGLTVGAQYYVHYFENARTVTTIPALAVEVGGSTVVAAHEVPPVVFGPYREVSSAVFAATATDMELAFIKSNPEGGDTTALIDSVAIVPVAPGTAPSISAQPQPVTVYLGQPTSFGVIAQGSLPLRYQWQLNGSPVADATNATLSIPAVRLLNEGDYTVVVANDFGSVTSDVARLSILERIVTLHNTGVDAADAPLAAGAVDPFWSLLSNPDSGSADALVCNEGWPIQSGVWLVNTTTSKWIGPRAVANSATAVGDYLYRTSFDLTGRDTNTVIINGRWASDNWGTAAFLNGAPVNVPASFNFGSWTSFTLTSSDVTFLPGVNTLDFAVNNAGPPGPTGLRVEFKTSARTLPGIPAGIAAGPQGGEVAEGDSFTFTVSATGTQPLNYQWRKNGVDLPGQTDATLTLTGLTTADSGDYSVKVSNQWGDAVSSPATLCVCFQYIPGIYGTGVANDGSLLPEGAVDLHYTLTASDDPYFPGPDALVITNVWPIASGVWVLNGPNSGWIGPTSAQYQTADPTQGCYEGNYTYRTTFDLTGYDLSKVTLTGGWAVDNYGVDIVLNDVSTGSTNSVGFASFTPFTITSGLVAGPNTLDFVVNNLPTTPNPTGLRVDLKGLLRIAAAPRPKLSISLSGRTISVSWSPTGAGQKLQSAPAVTGPWTDVAGAAAPYTTDATGAAQFFRVVSP